MKEFYEILDARIKADPNLNETKISVAIGREKSTVRQIIVNKRSPRIDTALDIVAYFNETLDQFLGVSTPPSDQFLAEYSHLNEDEQKFLASSIKGIVANRSQKTD